MPTVIDINNLISQYQIRLNKNIKNIVNNKFIALRNIKNNYILFVVDVSRNSYYSQPFSKYFGN